MSNNKSNKKALSKPKSSKRATDTEEIPVNVDKGSTAKNKQTDDTSSGKKKSSSSEFVKDFTWKHGLLLATLFVIVLFGGFGYRMFKLATQNIIDTENGTPLLEQLSIIVGNNDKPLEGEADDRINILLLGIGGEGHDGGKQTDSMMVASIKPSTNQVGLLSLPRDLIVKIYDDNNPKLWEGRKINLAYELGGADLAIEKTTEVTDLKIHYYILIDFTGFKKMVDDINGIDVEVERSFTGLYGSKELSMPCPTSQTYHLEDGDYCSIPFQRGVKTMDGEQALIFSRIRKLAPGSLNAEEGTDFARAQRQQKILESFKEKLFSSKTLIRPDRIASVLADLGSHIDTNMELWEIAKFLQMASAINSENVISKVIDNSPTGIVYSTIAEQTGASVVVPLAGDYNYSDIHRLADNIFEHSETLTEESTVQVLNGTTYNGLAARTADLLGAYDVEVIDVGNSPGAVTATTVIYDLTNGEKNSSLELLIDTIGGEIATTKQYRELQKLDADGNVLDSSADFIIILGEDSITPITTTSL